MTSYCPIRGVVAVRGSVATAVGLLLVVACATQPQTYDLVSPSQLSESVIGRTLHVDPAEGKPHGSCSGLCCSSPYYTILVYLAPDGTGWLDNEVIVGGRPQPSEMSRIIEWHVAGPSQVCIWAAPLIGEMSSFAGPHSECVEVFRSRQVAGELRAVVTKDGLSRSGALLLYSFNAFSASAVDQYEQQVRVWYGGRMPVWTRP